ncbi:MAG: glycine cleavage system aminomethyltransferase GcvT, partial [bacterium]
MKRLPLHRFHQQLGATFGQFAGFEMPLYYRKPLEEHRTVRQTGGVFDVSHMAQLAAEGGGAADFFRFALANDAGGMGDGEALYSPICREDGGVLDDLIVYRRSASVWRIVVNAANRAADLEWLSQLARPFGVAIGEVAGGYCLFAVQGPQVFSRLKGRVTPPPDSLGYFRCCDGEAFGVPVLIARTGYTGEPGCELAVAESGAARVWEGLTGSLAIPPIGLAARDSLRLEACMALYGHELRAEWHPFESGLGWAVKLERAGDFMGKEALARVRRGGSSHLQAALRMIGRGVPRAGYPVLLEGRQVGEVTSGTFAPTTGAAVALAHLEAAAARRGTALA